MSLKEELTALRSRLDADRTPDELAKMHQAVEELRKSGAPDRVAKVGDKAPEFVLPNANESLVHSKALLAKGPLVLTFYRGRW
jgi:hypothetical protein